MADEVYDNQQWRFPISGTGPLIHLFFHEEGSRMISKSKGLLPREPVRWKGIKGPVPEIGVIRADAGQTGSVAIEKLR